MEYLLQAMRKNRRRIKFEQMILLATRCSLLALLGLALARPRGCSESTIAALGQRSALHVFVIDNSYSMAYEADRANAKTHLDQAKVLAKQQIEKLVPGSESVAIVLASRPLRDQPATTTDKTKTPERSMDQVILRPTYDLQAAGAAVDRIEQSYAASDLASALESAAQVAREEQKQPDRYLYILSDCTRAKFETSKAEVLKQVGKELPSLFTGERHIRLMNLARDGQWNYAVLDIWPDSPGGETRGHGGIVRKGLDSDFLASVKGFGGTSDAVLQWKWDEKVLPDAPRLRPDDTTKDQRQQKADLKQGGIHVIAAALLDDERLKVDNTRRRVVEVASGMKVLIVEGDRKTGAGSLDYVLAPKREIAPTGEIRSETYIIPEVTGVEFASKVLTDYRAVVLSNVDITSWNSTQADNLRKFVEQGGTLMIFMGEQVRTDAYNDTLHSRKLLPGKLVSRQTIDPNRTDEVRAFTFDFRPNSPDLKPILGIFKGEEQCGLDQIPIETYYRLDPDPQLKPDIVLSYQEGKKVTNDPAILIHAVGKGRVVTFTTAAGSPWNHLPQRPSSSVALIHELLAGTVSTGDRWLNLTVGQGASRPRQG